MKEIKYSVIIDEQLIAQHMALEVASTLVQALCEKWGKDLILEINIVREPVSVEEE